MPDVIFKYFRSFSKENFASNFWEVSFNISR